MNYREQLRNVNGEVVLDLSNNRLTELPPEIMQLTSLTRLDLYGNQLTVLPSEIGQLTSLTRLYLGGNKLTALRPEIGQLPSLIRLNLNGNQLTTLPPEIGQLPSLTRLDLRGNQLTALPPELGQLTSLTTLDLFGNKLRALPPEIGQLTSLTRLNLASNQLTTFPLEIVQLTSLTMLKLDGNQLTTLPPEIVQLTSLTSLDLRGNQLTTLPPEIGQLTSLTKLDLSGNQLTALPPEIVQLTAKFEAKWVGSGILLEHNPWVSPPIEIIHQGDHAIRRYLALSKSRRLNEVKVILVGEGGAGKTSLAKRLLGLAFDPQELETHGINIAEWLLDIPEGKIRVKLWDFGGQEIMHATHQFFLTQRCLYLLVLDGRRDERADYWLKNIQIFGGDSPVLILLNKADKNPGHDLDRPFYSQRYRAIRGFLRLTCAEPSQGIEELRLEISKQLSRLEMVKTDWPERWFAVKQALEAENAHTLGKDRYDALCAEHGILEEGDRTILVRFLNDLGVAIHFDKFRLKGTFVLEPRWATSGVYRVVTSEQLARGNGVIDHNQFETILAAPSQASVLGDHTRYDYPPQLRPFILDLMLHFELCYLLAGDRIMVPDLLPGTPPRYDFDRESALQFRVTYPLLPRTVLPRLMVARHEEIEDGCQWRTGVVLRHASLGTRTLIQADYDQNQLLFWFSGSGIHQYLFILNDALGRINQGFQQAKIVNQVVCICPTCRASSNPSFFPLQKLFDFYTKGYREWPCTQGDEFVSIAEVLGHSLTGDAASLEKILEAIIALKDTTDPQAVSKLRQRITDLGTAASISGGSLLNILSQFLG